MLADPSVSDVPKSIGAALEARLASLPDGAAQFVRYAAVLGRQFDWHVVGRRPAMPARGRDRRAAPGDKRAADRCG